jgi:hypothetical protein
MCRPKRLIRVGQALLDGKAQMKARKAPGMRLALAKAVLKENSSKIAL